MRYIILIWMFIIGGVQASTESPIKPHIKEYVHPPAKKQQDNIEVLSLFQSKLDAFELKTEQLESDNAELMSKYEQILKRQAKFELLNEAYKTNAIKLTNFKVIHEKLKKEHSLLLDSNNSNGFEVWTGILLACVAILVTVLGVGVALLAFWGFRNIKEASIKASTEESIASSELIIIEAIQSGHFNDAINSVVEEVVYRGIMSEDDFPPLEAGDSDEV